MDTSLGALTEERGIRQGDRVRSTEELVDTNGRRFLPAGEAIGYDERRDIVFVVLDRTRTVTGFPATRLEAVR